MEKFLAMDEAELRDAPEADKSVINLKSVKGKKGRRFWRTAGGRAAIAFLTVLRRSRRPGSAPAPYSRNLSLRLCATA